VYILYGGRFTRSIMVEMVMAEGDIEYERREVDIIKQEHRSPEFLAISPTGFVPVMITSSGETLYETPAINLYLAEQHGLTHLAPRSDEPERGRFLSGIFNLTDELEPAMKRYFYPHRYVLRSEDVTVMKQRSLDLVLDELSVIDRRLRADGPYFLGQRFSLVDLIISYWCSYIETVGGLAPYPALRRCTQLVADRPKLRAKFDEMAEMRKDYAQLQARGEGVA